MFDSCHLVLTCSCNVRLREPLQAAAPCAEGVAEIHEDPDEYDPLDEANDTQLQALLWEAAGRIRLERRAEDGMLEVAPNEEAQSGTAAA